MPNFVQLYRSTDQTSWPALEGTAGSLIALLDAVLVNGGTTNSVTGVTQSGTTCTATIPADTTLATGTYLTISGASPAGANGTFAITFVNSTSFTYQTTAGLGTITGTILYKRTELGWTKPLTGTNLAAFLPQVVTGMPQFYLRIDETGGTIGGQKECAVRGYETMSDINTGTGPFPTVLQEANGVCWRKSATADGTDRPWVLIGDGSTFYFIPNSDASTSTGRLIVGFGGFVSFKVSDAYNCFISGNRVFNSATASPTLGASSGGLAHTISIWGSYGVSGNYAARSFSQTGGSIGLCAINPGSSAHNGLFGISSAGITYPAPVDGGLWVGPVMVVEATATPRGRLPGVHAHLHTTQPFAQNDTATNVAGLSGVTLTALNSAVQYSGVPTAVYPLVDTFGPWT